jgi:hypothetical protein
MIVKAQSRDGKETLEFDPELEPHHPGCVVLNGKLEGHKFRKKHLEILGYLMARKNEEISYFQIAKEVWETTVGGPYGTIYKTTHQVAALIGNGWLKHKPNVSIEFCTLIRTERPASDYALLKESENVPVEANGTRVASLWVPPFRQPLFSSGANRELTLLLAKTAITDLVGRGDLWQDCLAWCDDPSIDPVSVFCIQGRGGSGKTRFALELVHHLRSLEGWDARFVRFEKSEAFDLCAKTAGSNHVLLVFDYASDHGTAIADSLRFLSVRPPGPATNRLRILLLARSARLRSGWLLPFESNSTLEHGQAPSDYFRPDNPIGELAPLSIEDRIRVFQQTYYTAAKHLGLPDQTLDEADLHGDHTIDVLRDPLSLMFTALVGLRNGVPSALLLTKSELAREVAKLLVEQRLRAAFPENAALALHMTAYATISSGLTLGAALETMMRESQALHLGSIADPSDFSERLAAWLPGNESSQLGAIEPDILGEAFVLDQLCTRGEDAKEILCRFVQDQPGPAVRFIIRLVQDFSLVKAGPRAEPLEWLGTIIERGYVKDYELLSEILYVLPPSYVKVFPEIFIVLEKINTQIMSMASANKGELPERLLVDLPALTIELSCAEHLAGTNEISLLRIDEAISEFGEIEKIHGAAGVLNFALSLDSLIHVEEEMGLIERALTHRLELVRHFRLLAGSECGFFVPYFGNALFSLLVSEEERDQWDSLEPLAQEAVAVFQRLSEGNSAEFEIKYMISLLYLGRAQAATGNSQAALTNTWNVVNTLDQKVRDDRGTFLPLFAVSLGWFASAQRKADQLKEALASEERAVACYRELVEHDRGLFLSDLEERLSNVSIMECDAGNYTRALAIAQEVVILNQEIAERQGALSLPSLSKAVEFLEFLKMHSDSDQRGISGESPDYPPG